MLRITALAARPFLASPPPDEEDGEELSLDGFILPPCIASIPEALKASNAKQASFFIYNIACSSDWTQQTPCETSVLHVAGPDFGDEPLVRFILDSFATSRSATIKFSPYEYSQLKSAAKGPSNGRRGTTGGSEVSIRSGHSKPASPRSTEQSILEGITRVKAALLAAPRDDAVVTLNLPHVELVGGGVTSFSVSLTRQALLDLNCFTLPLPIRCGGLSVTPIDSLVASIARLSPQIVFLSAGASDWLGARVLSAGAARAVIACSASVLSPALAASIAQTLYTHLGELCSGKSTDKLSIDALVECAAAAVTAADVPGIVFMSSPSPLPSPVSVPTPIASLSPVQILVTQDILDDDAILCKRLCFGVLVPSSNPTAPAKVITSQSRLIPSTQSLLAIPLGSGTVYTLSMEGTSESIATFAVSVKWSSATSWSRSSPTMLLTRNDVSSPASTSNTFRSLSAAVPTLILPSGACQTIGLLPTLEVTAALPAEYTGLPVFARNEVMGLLYPILPLSPAPLESDSSPGQQLLLGSCDRIHTLTFQPSVQPALQLFKVLPLPTDKTIADSGTAKVTVVDPSVAETLELEAPPVSGKGRSLLITLGVVAAVACVLNSGTRASLLAQLKSLRALRK